MASAMGMKNFVSSTWTPTSEDTAIESIMPDLSRRVANDPAAAPRPKTRSEEIDEAGKAAPIPPLSRHLKQIAVSVVAVGVAFYGITTITAWYRQSSDGPAPHRGLSVKIATIPAADVADPNAQIAARFGTLTLALLEAERQALAKPEPEIAVVPSKISKVQATENSPPAVDAPLAVAPAVTAPMAASPAVAAPATTETTPAPVVPSEATVAEINDLLVRGDGLLASGNIAAARLFYSRAASLGSGRGAMMSGKTYDPRFLATIPVSGIAPDRDQAATWYRRGVALGDGGAAERLAGLTGSGQ